MLPLLMTQMKNACLLHILENDNIDIILIDGNLASNLGIFCKKFVILISGVKAYGVYPCFGQNIVFKR